MSDVQATLRDGSVLALEADGDSLMEILRNGNAGVDGTCGGACSCGTCHVYVTAEWQSRLPPAGEDESMMLDALGEFVERRPGSRLACQIPWTSALKGIAVVVAPQAE